MTIKYPRENISDFMYILVLYYKIHKQHRLTSHSQFLIKV